MEKKYFLYFVFILIGVSSLFSSCSLFNPPEVIPCYGHIDSIPLIITNPSTQGTSANGINCAWVYVDDNPVGAFQLPCTFPMIATTGSHLVTIFAGVNDNGAYETRIKFPFYLSYVLSGITLTQGQVTKFKPTTKYAPWTNIAEIIDFENPFISLIKDTIKAYGCDTNLFVISKPNPNVYQGNGSGEVYIDQLHNMYIGFTDTFNIPNNGNAVFLEFNYKATTAFTVGMTVDNYNGTARPPLVVFDTATIWKKEYVNLQTTISQYTSYDNVYSVYFQFSISTTGTNKIPNAQLYLDNIKVDRYN